MASTVPLKLSESKGVIGSNMETMAAQRGRGNCNNATAGFKGNID